MFFDVKHVKRVTKHTEVRTAACLVNYNSMFLHLERGGASPLRAKQVPPTPQAAEEKVLCTWWMRN